jgi:hypothetical protein
MRYFDLGVILVYLAGITWFGARFRSRQRSLRDYFLGGRQAPWWAIGFSIVSAETSTLTVIGTPALAYQGNFGFLQVVLGYLLARIVISTLFLPHYFRGEMYTAYELMRRRFGEGIRRWTACLFLVLRALAEGVRVFAISIVISIVLGTGELASILLIVCLTLFYTFEGGMTAVIWTDVVQMILYIAGAVVSFFVILGSIPGGWDQVRAVAGAAGKFQIFDFQVKWSREFFSKTYTFWAGLLGGCFLTTASHGSRHRAVDGAASAGSPEPAPGAGGPVLQLGGDLLSIHSVPGDRRPALCVLSGLRPGAPQSAGPHLPVIYLEFPAAGRRRTGDRSDFGRGDVQPERGFELAGFDQRHGSLQTDPGQEARPANAGSATAQTGAPGDACLGRDPVRHRLDCAPMGIGARSGPLHRLGAVRFFARRVPAGSLDPPGRRKRRDSGDAGGFFGHALRQIADYDRLDLVRHYRDKCDIPGWDPGFDGNPRHSRHGDKRQWMILPFPD